MSKAKKRVAKKSAAAVPEMSERGKAISKSWADPAVAKARNTRNRVKVGKKVYRSTRAAFVELGLPAGRCIAFRGKLKASGKLAFVADDGKKTMFVIVKE